MMTLSVDEAFRAYEAVRHRLPAAVPRDAPPRQVHSLADLAEEFDTFLLDAYGVLNIGDSAIPGTRERIEALRAAGKRCLVVSNAASVPRGALAEKYRRLGYDFGETDIVTSRDTMAAALDGRRDLRWGLMADAAGTFDDLGTANGTILADEPHAYDRADGFLLIGSAEWTGDRQTLLEASIATRSRPVLVANPDIVAPREFGLSAEPGHFAHRLADRGDTGPKFYGKPFANIFELAFARLPAPVGRSRTVMVGDSLHTDILGAQAAGIASALVTGYGFLAGRDAHAAIRQTGIVPDVVLTRP